MSDRITKQERTRNAMTHTAGNLHVSGDGTTLRDARGCFVCSRLTEANAARIIKTWNAHDELVAALRAWVEPYQGMDEETVRRELPLMYVAPILATRALLAKVEDGA